MESKNQVVKGIEAVKEFKKINFESIDFKSIFKEKENIFDVDYVLVDKAYNKLQEMYNSCEQQRKFVHHLIKAFLPLDMWHRMMLVDKEIRCCILNYKITGISNVAGCYGKVSMERMMVECKANTENREQLTDDEVTKIQSTLKEYPCFSILL